ncbi:MAG: phosphoribosylanthranilate isomerase [Rhodospirillaceae bacterium]|nr:phosphoribosylanthranilate isomerase [Rhodospirillaceae bacterium]
MLLGGLISAAYIKATKARAKICGINSKAALKAAVDGGAAMLGFVFFPASPRAITTIEAGELMAMVPDGIIKVALLVDPTDQDVTSIAKALPIDAIQLHGSETPSRVTEIKALIGGGLQVFKAVTIATPEDVVLAHEYEKSCDRLLLDAKAPADATRPGGNAITFDWKLISNQTWEKPWLLAGGLTAKNVGNAIAITNAEMVDVSSGVEDAPGVKNPAKITIFLGAVEDGG